jgi:membrane associated rhomboid family serine protease
MIQSGGLVPYEITHLRDIGPESLVPIPFTVFTSMFLHADLMHLGGNMLYLWIFGNNIEDELGKVFFLPFYVAAGLAAAGLQVAFAPNSEIPMVGASGAIAGVLGAYLVAYPHARVRSLVFLFMFVRLVDIPAYVLLGFWFVLQIASSLTGGGAGVAWWAHIGGFAFGALFFLGRRVLKGGARGGVRASPATTRRDYWGGP